MNNAPLSRWVYLGFAFPPGVSDRFPQLNPAGHLFETALIRSLSALAPVTSVGLLPRETYEALEPRDDSPGLDHELVLWERQPELVHRWLAWRELQHWWRVRRQEGRAPAVVLVYNLHPIYVRFIAWLRQQADRPRLVLLLADSNALGQQLSAWKRFRYQFKPMQVIDSEAIRLFDACVALSKSTSDFFAPQGVPWLWMPGGCNPADRVISRPTPEAGPIRFGYFGALAPHTGVLPMTEAFLSTRSDATLSLCGYGKLAPQLGEMARQHPRLRFDGLQPTPQDCLNWAQQVDVLINPRPFGWGNENNFPSKIFQYALAGRAILTSNLSGIDAVLGDEAFYFDAREFAASLLEELARIARLSRMELHGRGRRLCERICQHYSWSEQARRLNEFIAQQVLAPIR